MPDRRPVHLALPLLALAVLAFVAYLPGVTIPLLEDDFPNIWQSLDYGSATGVHHLFHDAVFRLRATSYWTMFLLWQTSKLAPVAYHLVSIAMHIVNVWLLYAVCRSWPGLRPAAFWAAAFFAIAEGHQEAVMWFSAINELLQFLFGIAALLCWNRVAARHARGPVDWLWEIGGIFLFTLALLSKESAVILLPLFLLMSPPAEWRRSLLRMIPYVVLAGLAVASVLSTRTYSFRFSDGSFSLHAPVWITWPRSYFRLLWIWGLVACAAIAWARNKDLLRTALLPLIWIAIAFLPYSFLTYMTAIPSRQTYLASAGSAMLVGLAMAYWFPQLRARPRWFAAILVLVLAHNLGYLWTRKRRQFQARAEPTTQLIALARRTPGPIWVQCFPRPNDIAETAVNLGAGYAPSGLVWTAADADSRHATAVFCYREGNLAVATER